MCGRTTYRQEKRMYLPTHCIASHPDQTPHKKNKHAMPRRPRNPTPSYFFSSSVICAPSLPTAFPFSHKVFPFTCLVVTPFPPPPTWPRPSSSSPLFLHARPPMFPSPPFQVTVLSLATYLSFVHPLCITSTPRVSDMYQFPPPPPVCVSIYINTAYLSLLLLLRFLLLLRLSPRPSP